jgi:hypothetical protein
VDTILHDSMEAAEYALDALEEHRILDLSHLRAWDVASKIRTEAAKIKDPDRRMLLEDAADKLAMSKG